MYKIRHYNNNGIKCRKPRKNIHVSDFFSSFSSSSSFFHSVNLIIFRENGEEIEQWFAHMLRCGEWYSPSCPPFALRQIAQTSVMIADWSRNTTNNNKKVLNRKPNDIQYVNMLIILAFNISVCAHLRFSFKKTECPIGKKHS